MVDWGQKICAEGRLIPICSDDGSQLESAGFFRRDWHAEIPTPHLQHEIDRLGRDRFCSADEITFVFPILGVDDNQQSSLLDGGNC